MKNDTNYYRMAASAIRPQEVNNYYHQEGGFHNDELRRYSDTTITKKDIQETIQLCIDFQIPIIDRRIIMSLKNYNELERFRRKYIDEQLDLLYKREHSERRFCKRV